MNVRGGREEWIDAAKGIAILAVVLGHTYQFGNAVHSFVYSFHIPLFFLLSGYFCKPVGPDIRKTAARLLLPYFLLCVVMICISLVSTPPSAAWFKKMALIILWASGGDVPILNISGVGIPWFLMALFLAKIMYGYIQVVFERCKIPEAIRFVVFFGLMLGAWKLSEFVVLPLAFSQAVVAMFYLYCGTLLHREEELFAGRKRAVLAFASFVVWAFTLSQGYFYSIGNLFHVGPLLLGIVMSLSSSYCLIVFCRLFACVGIGKAVQQGLAFIGMQSLFILCVHWLESNFLQWALLTDGTSLFRGIFIGFQHLVTVLLISLMLLKALSLNDAKR